MKLEVGMYVRYKYEENVYIGKITFISEVMCGLNETLQIEIDNCMEEILIRDMLKASHNIIDLIEVGDVITTINLCGEITKIDKENNKIYTTCYDGEYCHKEDIKSIVTHEQFSAMEYKLESEVK